MKWYWLAIAAVLAMGETARRILATGYKAGQPLQLELQSIGNGFYLNRNAAAAFLAMQEAALQEGVRLVVSRAFATMEQQLELKRRSQTPGDSQYGIKTAEPGYSNHQLGLAVDLQTAGGTNDAYRWLEANAHRFDFARTVRSEAWHWEYTAPWAEVA